MKNPRLHLSAALALLIAGVASFRAMAAGQATSLNVFHRAG